MISTSGTTESDITVKTYLIGKPSWAIIDKKFYFATNKIASLTIST